MKISKNIAFVLLALSKLIVADSETFGLLTIRSGSDLQYASVYSNDGKLMLGSSSDSLSGTVTDAGKLKLSDDTYAVVDSDGSLIEGSESDASSGFSIEDGYLAYNNVDGFQAIQNGSSYVFSTSSVDGSTGVAIKAVSSGGSSVPDFSPSSTSESSSSTSSTAETSASDSSASPTATSSVSYSNLITTSAAAISQITDGQIQAFQTENGAPKAAIGIMTGFVAAAAALLF